MSGLNPPFVFAGEVTDDTPGLQTAEVVLHILTNGAYVPVAKFSALGLCLMKDGTWIQIPVSGVLVVDEPTPGPSVVSRSTPLTSDTSELSDTP